MTELYSKSGTFFAAHSVDVDVKCCQLSLLPQLCTQVANLKHINIPLILPQWHIIRKPHMVTLYRAIKYLSVHIVDVDFTASWSRRHIFLDWL